jgi:hypothetical protein
LPFTKTESVLHLEGGHPGVVDDRVAIAKQEAALRRIAQIAVTRVASVLEDLGEEPVEAGPDLGIVVMPIMRLGRTDASVLDEIDRIGPPE